MSITFDTIYSEPPFPLVLAPSRRAKGLIEAPVRLPRAWRRQLAADGPVEVGSPARPFVSEGGSDRALRRLFERLEQSDPRDLRLCSYGPDLVGHGERLARLDSVHAVRIDIPVPSLDPLRVHRIDPRGPHPRARLTAIERLAALGLTTRARVRGVHDGGSLDELFAALRSAGAWDVVFEPERPRSWWSSPISEGHPASTLAACRLRHGFPRGSGRG